MGLHVSRIQEIGKIKKRGLFLSIEKNLRDPIMDRFDSFLIEAKHVQKIVFCGLGSCKDDLRFFSNLPHEKLPGLDAYGRFEKLGELEMDQVLNRDDQFLGNKKGIKTPEVN